MLLGAKQEVEKLSKGAEQKPQPEKPEQIAEEVKNMVSLSLSSFPGPASREGAKSYLRCIEAGPFTIVPAVRPSLFEA